MPILDLPSSGDIIDDFALGEVLSDGRYSRLFKATDKQHGREVVLKFPHPRVAGEGSYRLAFVREAWVAARVRSLWIGEIVELPAERQTRLYSVMPFYEGETLEQRLNRAPRLSLTEGIGIATKLVRAVTALHRAGIIHRDIKPDNVILLKDGGLRLVDLGVARVPLLEDFPAEDIPGTASYMAPELFGGKAGDEASDLFALGVTVYRMFTANYPLARSSRSRGRASASPRRCRATGRTCRRGSMPSSARRSVSNLPSVSATPSSSRTNWKTAPPGPAPRFPENSRCTIATR